MSSSHKCDLQYQSLSLLLLIVLAKPPGFAPVSPPESDGLASTYLPKYSVIAKPWKEEYLLSFLSGLNIVLGERNI
jgi:hypothetical protein